MQGAQSTRCNLAGKPTPVLRSGKIDLGQFPGGGGNRWRGLPSPTCNRGQPQPISTCGRMSFSQTPPATSSLIPAHPRRISFRFCRPSAPPPSGATSPVASPFFLLGQPEKFRGFELVFENGQKWVFGGLSGVFGVVRSSFFSMLCVAGRFFFGQMSGFGPAQPSSGAAEGQPPPGGICLPAQISSHSPAPPPPRSDV